MQEAGEAVTGDRVPPTEGLVVEATVEAVAGHPLPMARQILAAGAAEADWERAMQPEVPE